MHTMLIVLIIREIESNQSIAIATGPLAML